jgi:putative CocE/NonD family hydrolase
MGDNQWLYADNWSDISRNYDTLYLRSNNRLLDTPPPPIMGAKDIPPDTIIYDPRNPSPTYGGARFNPFDLSVKLGPQDILQVVESRNDVLSYTSDYNKDGIVINGSVRIFLHVGSDRKDTDFGVRLTEVLRDGQSIILTQGIKRMRFRESLSEEILIEKDSIYIVEIDMEPLNIRLNKDSRLRIVVSSSNYPMFDINLNNGDELYKSGDTLIATNLVYRRNNSSSHIIIPFVDQATGIYDFTKKDKRAKVFPNPAYGFIFFDTDGKDMNFIIFNSIGIRVLSGNTKGSIDVSTLSAGVYFVMLGSADGRNNESIKFSIVR